MTAPPEGRPPASEADTEPHMAAQPDRGQADEGRHGSASRGGHAGPSNATGDGAGTNAQSGTAAGSEGERHAPGISTDKKADDTK